MVIAKRMEPLVAGSSIIRKLFEEGKEMAKKVGAENVYDYSLGNPSVPAPDAVKSSIIKILDTEDPLFVHGYMSNSGYEEVRQAVADNLNERFQWQYKMEDIIMTVGAASGINDTVIHLATSEMGFGGFGESGMGAYHGKTGFDTFSHYKSIVDKKTWMDLPMRYQPYNKVFDFLIRLFMH